MKNHPDFNKNSRKFFGIDNADTKSEFNRAANKFYGVDPTAKASPQKGLNTTQALGETFMNVQTNVQVNPNSEMYQRNAAAFYGGQPEDIEVKSQGSIYQKNKANFYGTDYQKNDVRLAATNSKAFANQNQQQVNMKSGHFKQDAAKFYGMDHLSET